MCADRLRAGIVGTGFIAAVHAHAIQAAGGSVAALVGRTREDAEAAVGGMAPGARVTDDVRELFDGSVDVVHVCTPNGLHLPIVRQVIDAGLHVVCEKPLATSLADARTMFDLARDAAVVATVPFIYRYYTTVRAARARIRADQDNPLWLLHGSYLQDWLADRADTNWRVDVADGGRSRAFADIGVHWCDLMEFVTGQRIMALSARFANAHPVRSSGASVLTEDGAVVAFETDAGSCGSLVVSQASAGRKNRLWFSFDGPRHSYEFDQENPETLWVGGTETTTIVPRDPRVMNGDVARFGGLPAGHPEGYQKCFNDFVRDTYGGITAGLAPDTPTFEDGVRAATLTEAVITSATSRAEWVTV